MYGVRIAVKMPFTISPMLDIAPNDGLISIDREVPTAWAAVPIDRPCATGFFTRVHFMMVYPKMAPKMPTTITTEAEVAAITAELVWPRQLQRRRW